MMRPIRRLRLIGFSTAVERTTCGVSHHVIAFVILCEAEEWILLDPDSCRLQSSSENPDEEQIEWITVGHGDIITIRRLKDLSQTLEASRRKDVGHQPIQLEHHETEGGREPCWHSRRGLDANTNVDNHVCQLKPCHQVT
ncbi:unnamed protein product [Arctogadus glacialis]